jgi:hypothetical protein
MSSTYSTTASSLVASGASMSNACAFFELEITPSEACVQIKSYSDISVGKEIEKENVELRIQLAFIPCCKLSGYQ